MQDAEIIASIEAMLFMAGDPVLIVDLQKITGLTDIQLRPLLYNMEQAYHDPSRGLMLRVTQESVQLCTKPDYSKQIERLLQPTQTKNLSQSLLETLAIIAYRQPATRSDVEIVRGVRCEYTISQLLKLGLITPVGKKNVVGHPVLYATTDAFLHHFGIHSLDELPQLPILEFSEES